MSDDTQAAASPAPASRAAPAAAEPSRRNNIIGALLMVLCVLCFAIMDAVLKGLVNRYDLIMLAWGRNVAQAGVLLAVLPLLGARKVLTTQQPRLQILRGACLACSTLAIMSSLKLMTLTQTYVAMMSAPLVAAALAGLLLGERASGRQWLWIVGGFAGVVIALDPAAPEIGTFLTCAAAMALVLGTYHVLTRKAARLDQPFTQLYYVILVSSVLLTPLLLAAGAALPLQGWALLTLAGVFGIAAHFLMALAFRYAPPAVVSPMVYVQIVWAALADFVVFGTMPTWGMVAGGLIVTACGIAIVSDGPRKA